MYIDYSIFSIGVKDSANPYTLSAIFIFLTFLFKVARDAKRIVIAGMFFIASAWIAHALLSLGLFDRFLLHPRVTLGLHIANSGIALCFVGCGLWTLANWWAVKMGTTQLVIFQWFRFDQPLQGGKFSSTIKLIGLSLLVGLVVVLLGSVWPQEYLLFVKLYFLLSAKDIAAALTLVGLYSFALIVPLFLVWLMIVRLTQLGNMKEKLAHWANCIQISVSALLVSVGLSMVYIFLRLNPVFAGVRT